MGATEPSSDDAGFYFNLFFFPKCTGGLQPIRNLKWFNHDMYIPTFKVPTIRYVWQLIQSGDNAFAMDHQECLFTYSYTLTSSSCFTIFWHMPYLWKDLPFGRATAPRVFTALTKPILFLCPVETLVLVH